MAAASPLQSSIKVDRTPLTFEILYYKRTNKVHKSRGVSKFDGKLIVSPPPFNFVQLMEVANDDDDDDNEATKPKCLYNRAMPEIAKQTFGPMGLNEDDTLVVGPYEVQVISASVGVVKTDCAEKVQPRRNHRFVPLSSHPTRLQSSSSSSSSVRKFVVKSKRTLPPSRPQLSRPTKKSTEDSSISSTGSLAPSLAPRPNPLTRKRFTNPLLSNKPKRRVVVSSSSGLATSSDKAHFPDAVGRLVVPAAIRTKLRPHQRTGIEFLWNCLTGQSADVQIAARNAGVDANDCRGAILADEMGLGKTLMTIATIFALHRRRKDDRFIVVCPSSLVMNWAKEFDKWLGRASQPKRVMVQKGGEEGQRLIRSFVRIKPNQSEVLIISYDLFRLHSSLLTQARRIGLLVVDEGHRLKNTAGSQTMSALEGLSCEARLLITGTPIQNNLLEFFTVSKFVCPGLLGDMQTFRRDFERPINAANNKDASWDQCREGQAQSVALERITRTFMLRRLQKDILKPLLPSRNEFLLFCRPSQQQCHVYRRLTDGIVERASSMASADALTALSSLRKLCCHPFLLDGSLSYTLELSGKLLVLNELLREIRETSPDDKVVIVSNFTTALTAVEDLVLKPNSVPFSRLDGSTDQASRQNLVDSFNRSSSSHLFAFLLSSKSGGCGLNLVGANRLVMLDADFNPATDAQAMARIYRQGQTKQCYIYRLFTSGTVEEVIYQRQQAKGHLATITVDGKSCTKQNSSFTKDELRDCFTLKEGCRCDTKDKVGAQWPVYEGAQSLTSLGCDDNVLLQVSSKQTETLGYIHIVAEEAHSAASDRATSWDEDPTDGSNNNHEDSSSCYDSSESEENEFMD